MPVDHFALDLKADQQEEQGHQPVVDPQKQGFGDFQRANLGDHGNIQQAVVQVRQRRVVDDQGQGSCSNQ
ncbi:hypothetical protein D9M71_467900 [compost metagenome]